MELLAADPAAPESIARAAATLAAGGLVAFPTETVYGLGADARNPTAVARLFAVKGRPPDNPLIVHVADVEGLAEIAAPITPLARRLAAAHWPGPLTLVLDARPGLAPGVASARATVGVRVPAHPVALALLRAAAVPVAAPSANRSGRPSPTRADHVVADLGDLVDIVLDAGPCPLGVESTVVDARGEVPLVLRDGGVPREALAAAADSAALGLSPGTSYAHYQPACRMIIAAAGSGPAAALEAAASGARVGLVSAGPPPPGVIAIATPADAAALAAVLYAAFRDAEAAGIEVLVVEAVAETGLGRAVMDRLRRAAGV